MLEEAFAEDAEKLAAILQAFEKEIAKGDAEAAKAIARVRYGERH
jgi:hypothetical protein